jgi:hypothetical protein
MARPVRPLRPCGIHHAQNAATNWRDR